MEPRVPGKDSWHGQARADGRGKLRSNGRRHLDSRLERAIHPFDPKLPLMIAARFYGCRFHNQFFQFPIMLVAPAISISAHKSYEFGLCVGFVETYRHGFGTSRLPLASLGASTGTARTTTPFALVA